MTPEIEATCPHCGFGETAEPGAKHRCDHCGTVYEIQPLDGTDGSSDADGAVWDIRDQIDEAAGVFYPSRSTAFLQLLGGGFVLLGGGYSAIKGDRSVWPLVLIGLGLVGGSLAFNRLFTRSPEIVVNARGIHTRGWRVLWSSITNLNHEYRGRGKTIVQHLRVESADASYSVEVTNLSATPGTIVNCVVSAVREYRPDLPFESR